MADASSSNIKAVAALNDPYLSMLKMTERVCTAGEHRLEIAGQMGIPQVMSPGTGAACHWGQCKPLPSKFRYGPQSRHNPLILVIGASAKGLNMVGRLMAEKLNRVGKPRGSGYAATQPWTHNQRCNEQYQR